MKTSLNAIDDIGVELTVPFSASSTQSWMPIHNIWQWTNPDTDDVKITVIVLLLTGVGERENDIHVSLENSNTVLNIRVLARHAERYAITPQKVADRLGHRANTTLLSPSSRL